MVSRKIGAAVAVFIAMFLAMNSFAVPAVTAKTSADTLRFTVVKRTPQYVLAERRQERVVVWKGHPHVVQHGVAVFVVVRVTRRYVYLKRMPAAPVIVNVRDYGANGDGVVDDHAAVRKACAAASAVGGTVS